MGETIFVKPVEGATVRYPVTMTALPIEGAEVPWDASSEGVYWRRRVNDGSVKIVESKPAVNTTADIQAAEIPSAKRRT